MKQFNSCKKGKNPKYAFYYQIIRRSTSLRVGSTESLLSKSTQRPSNAPTSSSFTRLTPRYMKKHAPDGGPGVHGQPDREEAGDVGYGDHPAQDHHVTVKSGQPHKWGGHTRWQQQNEYCVSCLLGLSLDFLGSLFSFSWISPILKRGCLIISLSLDGVAWNTDDLPEMSLALKKTANGSSQHGWISGKVANWLWQPPPLLQLFSILQISGNVLISRFLGIYDTWKRFENGPFHWG